MKAWLCILSRGDAAEPAYDDLYPGDGSVWRFYATDVTGRLGELVSHTDARELLATLQKGGGQPRAYVYAFVNGDWGLRTPEGLEKMRELMESDDGFVTQAHTLTRKNGKTLARKVDTYEEAQWGFVKVRSEGGEGAASRWREWEYYFKTDAAVGAYKGKVRTWYAPDDARPFYARRLASVRDEDGSLRVYDYRVEDERWVETVTALHEQAPEPVSGRTTRSVTVYDRVGNVVERNQEAFIDGAWYLIDRTVYEYDIGGHVIKETDFAGRETVSVWGDACCGKVSETLPDGTRRTFSYDEEGNLLSQTTLGAGSHTVTYRRDDLGRIVRVEREGLNPETTDYDILGRVVRRVDVRGGVTEDGKEPSNEGFFDDGRVKPDSLEEHLKCCEFWTRYDDALMREAVRNVSKDMEPYDLLSNNCQDFVDMAKEEYYRLREQQDEERKHRTVMPDFRFGPPSVPHLTTPVH